MKTLSWSLAALLLASACSKDDTAAEGADPSSGGELTGDGVAKAVPLAPTAAPEPAAAPEPTAKAATRPVARPSAKKPAPNLWGKPDAESGTPLPARHKMNGSAASAFASAKSAEAKGDDKAAKTQFEKALSADPKAFQAAYNLGVLADRAGQTNKALNYYQRSLSMQADYEAAVQGTVNIHLRQGNASKAVSFAQPIAKKWERNLYLQAIVADALTRADRLDESEAAARRALKRDERFVPAMVSLAKASLRRGRVELAESIIQQAAVIDANNAEIHFLQGQAHQEAGHLGLALKSYRKAAEQRPDYAEARMALGIQYMAGGNYAQALAEFKTVVRLVPTLVAAHLNLGDAYRANKKWLEAKRSFDKALRMKGDLPEAHFNLALMYMSAGKDFPKLDVTEALKRAMLEFNNYRRGMGPRLKKDDPSGNYLADVQRQIEREAKRRERERKAKEREAARAARKKQMEAEQ